MTLIGDLETVRQEQARQAAELEAETRRGARHEEQINGERGLSAAINAQTAEIRGLRKAAYWVAGLIVAGSITMAFSAISLVH
jgi:hypothetical protein